MNKHLLKQTINFLNEFSLETNTDLVSRTFTEIRKQDVHITKKDIEQTIFYLEQWNALEWLDETLDMFPSTVIFGRSFPNSDIEALAAYEIVLRSKHSLEEKQIQDLLSTTTLLKDGTIREDLQTFCDQIKQEVKHSILTETLNILYTKQILSRKTNSEYRNEDKKMIDFDNIEFLLEQIPKKGIPVSREDTKDLQIFFKDTLMHEFDHSCPICHIKMPQLLIASHIKPFRDCAHIYEPATHDNGLLLCRNHDYLFDQGYITFTEDGQLIVSKALMDKDPKIDHFNFCDQLNNLYLTENRKKFLQYHRTNIFKGQD